MIRQIAVLAVVAAGLAALSFVSRSCAIASGVALMITLGAPLLRRSASRIPWPLMTLSVISLLSLAVIWEVPAAQALALLLVYLQVHNRLGRLGEVDDRTSVLLAVLMLSIGASFNRDLLFVCVGITFGAALPVSLSRGEMRLRTAFGLSLAGLSLSALLFLAAPRAQLSPDNEQTELTGFAPEVELGALDTLFDDPKVVFRASIRPIPDGIIYWRGLALDEFDGARWSSSSVAVPVSIQPGNFPHDAIVIEVEPEEPGPLFTAGWPLDIRVDGELLADTQGGFALRGAEADYRLVVQGPLGRTGRPSTPPETDPTAIIRALSLPATLDPRVGEIAAHEAGEGTVTAQMQRLSDWLRREFAYSRRPHDAGVAEPLTVFLFERRAGHCEYFATALAMLARAKGIPARIVNGFVGGTFDEETGWWTVRRSDAHTWVEYHDGGWVLADATPGPAATELPTREMQPTLSDKVHTVWEDNILGYDRRDQFDALLLTAQSIEATMVVGAKGFGGTGTLPWRGLLLLGTVALAVVLVVRLLLRALVHTLVDPPKTEPSGPIARAHHRARAYVAKQGYLIGPSLPPLEAARWLSRQLPHDATDALVELAWLYYAVHLGGEDPAPRVIEARALLERVHTLPPAQASTGSSAQAMKSPR